MRKRQQKLWCAFVVVSLVVGLWSCSSVTPVGSYDPTVPLDGEGKCKGHEHRCRDSCSSAGVKESTCYADVNGKIHVHCECREGPAFPVEPTGPTGRGIGRLKDEAGSEVSSLAG